jgi:NAD(P)H dehydrogenase (quinone)
MDQQEGLLAGTHNIGTSIIGRPLTTMEQFLTENRSQFFLPYLK